MEDEGFRVAPCYMFLSQNSAQQKQSSLLTVYERHDPTMLLNPTESEASYNRVTF